MQRQRFPEIARRTCASVLVNTRVAPPWAAAARLGHDHVVADKHYRALLRGVNKDATTIEQALGIEELAEEIVVRASQNETGPSKGA